ncbi:trifunctional MMPL family transporter/lysophospholipid acyltransferase/class I SAM-dependent methyltransferase [Pseudochryseolinea flava]|uniref:Glycerol acyltransferase n=1 Tax=Pseudochryseolinea flava TaxID=2059302 RepID=A0A364Y0H1_9BACT|nr:trifunctional MMPL family transporter/lysophospholipid acyltransferase/class I SAM-dependent methyltransferase [Pseudochryseolinea flava]RAW00155.1 glycerol acyltransferase [Pseudochryseolinea flava]
MEALFVRLYRFFKHRHRIFWAIFISVFALFGVLASRIEFEEDITHFFPDDKRVEKLNYIFQHSSMAERVVVMVSIADSSQRANADSLVSATQRLVADLDTTLAIYHPTITAQVDDQKILAIFDVIQNNLPVFLTKDDYAILDSMTSPAGSRQALRSTYKQLISPSGVALKRMLVEDPMGFSFLVLKKLSQLQYDENFELYDSYIVTRDHRHLIFFIQPQAKANDTGKNAHLVDDLRVCLKRSNTNSSATLASAFGATVVAVDNAEQIRFDTQLTLSILIVLIAGFILWFFRRKRVMLLIMVPVIFGALFSLACIYLMKGIVSTLALAAGSIILGIAINYALHFLVHLRHHPDKEQVIKDLVRPMLLGSTTTVLAFFSLQFTNATILRDVGLFAGFSLIGAALCSLIFLPHLISVAAYRENIIERAFSRIGSPHKVWIVIIAIVTPVLLYFASDVKFLKDMSALNFMQQDTKDAQARLETINPASMNTVYVSAEGKNLQEALRRHEQAVPTLDSLKAAGLIKRYHAVSSFLLSDSLQAQRIQQWNKYWSAEKKSMLLANTADEGRKLKFNDAILSKIDTIVNKQYSELDKPAFALLQQTFFQDNIIDNPGRALVVSLVNVPQARNKELIDVMQHTPAHGADRQMLTNLFVEFVHDDFNFIVFFTSILVFVVLLISTGRIEITLITFLPMLVTWIWILGIMALVGIEFNIINVMISTFIFGLGDDYSIFVMDGLQQEYKTGKKTMSSVRTSIFLSAVTTICGLGVLIFAKHPALWSIAVIAIIGIVCVFLMSQTLEPFIFHWLITKRTKRGLPPMTFVGVVFTIITYGIFVMGSFALTIIGVILKVIPFGGPKKQLMYHRLISFCNWLILTVSLNKVTVTERNDKMFEQPSIIIANHSSFLDILITTMLHPKLILLTNKWVYNSPIFGGVVRMAGYYEVTEGAEESIDHLRKKVGEGFSIVVFPEGTRSENGKLNRFHKGAFFLAEKLDLPIRPLLIHGANTSIPKSTIYVFPTDITLKFLPLVATSDMHYGVTYSERTKSISKHFKSSYQEFKASKETPRWFYRKLISNYLYKGPVLEWYARIKVKLEDNYAFFDELVPKKGTVLDLGCGYGFLSYMLQFRSEERIITGVDYDDDKISVAQNGFAKGATLNFFCADVTEYPLSNYDVIFVNDVLHYLHREAQFDFLERCVAALNPGGKIVVRDGNADLQERHQGTKLSELFSVSLLGFNKSTQALTFISGKEVTAFASARGWKLEVFDQTKLTSNIIFVISKDAGHGTV